MRKLYFSVVVLTAVMAKAQQFQEITPVPFKNFYYSAAAVGDADGDGFQDVYFTGAIEPGDDGEGDYQTYNEYYKNNAGVFSVQQEIAVNPVHLSDAVFLDFDNDGLLDVVTSGLSYSDVVNYKQYRYKNNGSTFDLVYEGNGKIFGGIKTFDFNHDGKLDYVLNGTQYTDSGFVNEINLYQSTGTGFTETTGWMPGSQQGGFTVADFNNDHLPDLMVYGLDIDTNLFFNIYLNNAGTLELSQELPPLYSGKMASADFNADGFLDAVVSGLDENYEPYMAVLMNDGNGQFTATPITEGVISEATIDVGDLNNDGYYDFIALGDDADYNGFANIFLYNPEDSTFSLAENTGLYNLGSGGTIKLFDYDNDRQLDVLMNGFDWNDEHYRAFTKLYKNSSTTANEKPEAPQTLNAEIQEDKIVFNWSNASDDKTPENALQYELSVGSQSGTSDIAKYVVTTKNWFLNKENLPEQIYWSVKSIDASKVYSDSSELQTLNLLAVSENSASDFGVYPNPVMDELHFNTKEKIHSVKVLNASGQLVKSQIGGQKSIQLRSLSTGLYIVEVQLENGKSITKKVLKK